MESRQCVCMGGGGGIQSPAYTGMLRLFDPPFSRLKVTLVDLSLRTISPVDPEYYGTHPSWDLNSQNHILSGGYQGQGTAQFTSSSQQHAGAPRTPQGTPVHGWALPLTSTARLSH